MKHMEKVQAAAKAAAEMTKDSQATCVVDYEPLMGYKIQIRWHVGLQPMGLNLVISEAHAGSDPILRQYVMGVVNELIEVAKSN